MKNILRESNTKEEVSYSGWNTDFSTADQAAKFDTADASKVHKILQNRVIGQSRPLVP